MARVFTRSARPAARRRLTTWTQSAVSTAFASAAAGTKIFDSSLTEAQLFSAGLMPSTIVRVRGSLYVKSDQVVASEEPFGAFGMMIVKEQARSIGVTALPDPYDDADDDGWFVWGSWSVHGGPENGDTVHRFDYDSKAMRKISEGDALVVMLTNNSAAHGAQFTFIDRTLFKVA